MPRKPTPFDLRDFRKRYLSGESLESMATKAHVGQTRLRKIFLKHGVEVRNRSDAMFERMRQLGPEGKRTITENAHAAVRGRKLPKEQVERAAHARAIADQSRTHRVGRFEDILMRMLRRRGLRPIPQEAFLGYNLDLGLIPIAVEVHVSANNPTADRKIRKRIENILEGGRWVIYVWITAAHPLSKGAVDKILAFLDLAKRKPSSRCEHRVIRGSGEFAISHMDRH